MEQPADLAGEGFDRRPLRRQLGLVHAVAILVGIVLGSGIFVAPAAVTTAAPSPLLASAFMTFGLLRDDPRHSLLGLGLLLLGFPAYMSWRRFAPTPSAESTG